SAALCSGTALTASSARAQQQTFHLDRLEVPGAPDDGQVLFRPVTQEHSIFYTQLGLGLAINPLRTNNITNFDSALRASSGHAVTSQFSSYLSAGFELLDSLTLGLTLPIAWEEAGNQPVYPASPFGGVAYTNFATSGPAVGDIRIDARYVAWRSADRSRALGFQLDLFAPSGTTTNFGGDGATSAMFMATGEWTPRHLPTFIANTGFDFRHDNSINDPAGVHGAPQGLGIADEWRWAIGALLPLHDGKFRLGATIFGQTGLTNDAITGPTFFTAQNTPIEWNIEGRMRLPIPDGGDHWFAGLSGGSRITGGYGAPDVRVVATIGTYWPIEDTSPYSPAARMKIRESIRESLKDTDGDG
ncbi:MAG: transporter, partial [Polyangiaceae bacterium]